MTHPSNKQSAGRYCITVRFVIVPGQLEQFVALVKENAATSIRDEPHCARFDVLLPTGAAAQHEVLLYEIYESQKAFEHHLRMPHFKTFDEDTRDMIKLKTVTLYELFENAKS
jgi:quinol monooxygenase YgiN